MKSYFTVFCFLILLLVSTFTIIFAQEEEMYLEPVSALISSNNHDPNFTKSKKKSFYQRKNDWQAIIDSTWGPGLPAADKLQIFDLFWNKINAEYAGFINLDVNWDSLKLIYRPEIAAGVSSGRFSAIMDQLFMALSEIHTVIYNMDVRGDSLMPGVPLLAYIGAYYFRDNGHFGAGLTPLPDSSLLVYKVIVNHPLGLEPGDIILGYNSIPWKYLYKELLAAELPVATSTSPSSLGLDMLGLGSSERSVSDIWLISAGLNWHLFDTLDVVKYTTGDTLHLSTSPLNGLNEQLICTDQMPVPGVPMPDMSRDDGVWITWGIVEGTQIGYIYGSSWFPYIKCEAAFRNAVDSLLNDYQTTGLIIDFRANRGGDFRSANGGYSRLFNFDPTVYFEIAERSNPNNHFAMTPVLSGYCLSENLGFKADPYLYDKPIAVLTGSATTSAGDFNSSRLKFHPMVRFLGKPTNTAYTCFAQDIHNLQIPFSGWLASYAPTNFFLSNDPGNYLMHVGFEVDEEILLSRNDVANGEDTVVKAAIAWINSMIHAYNVKPHLSFVKPGIDTLTITANVKNPHDHNLDVAALINIMDSIFVDSLSMFDDGNHGDSLAGDGLYGCYLNPLSTEDIFNISASITDLDSTHYHILPRASRFTTVGPVVVDSLILDTLIGDFLFFTPVLKNKGFSATAQDIKLTISSNDSLITNIQHNSQNFGNIAPGGTATSSSPYYYTVKTSNLPASHTFNFTFKIYSNNYHFWSDSINIDIVNDIRKKDENIPKEFALKQNYPNPFNPTTNIEFSIPKVEFVTLKIYNILGQEVTELVAKRLTPGNYKYSWYASGFASSVYYYKIEAGSFVQTKKLLLLK